MRDRIFRRSRATNLIVGFYPDEKQAGKALILLRRKRVFRSACISASENGSRRVRGHAGIVWPLLAAISLLPAILVLVREGSGYLAALTAAGVFGLAIMLRYRIGLALQRRVLTEYSKRVLPGEAMILVQCSPADTARLNAMLQESETASLFVIRPYFAAGLVAERPRRESLSSEQLKQHAVAVAESHSEGTPSGTEKSIFEFLKRWETIIETICRELAKAVELDQSITPSAEWLLDNAYVIQNHIHDIRRNLPEHYPEILPVLAGSDAGVNLRILNLALELVNKTDGNISIGAIHNFLSSYQDSRPLTIAELWTFPLMVRYALIEDLAHQALRVSQRQHDRERADFWANRLLSADHRFPDRVPVIFSEISFHMPVLQPHFAIRLMDQLTEEETLFSAAQKWLEGEMEMPLQEIIHGEHARQSSKQISIANDVTSLRRLAQMDWRESFEQFSLVEKILRRDAVYAGSDFVTRDHCRRSIEEIARYAKSSEIDVAAKAIKLATQSPSSRTSHVAYFLIDRGKRDLESLLGCRHPLREGRLRWMLDHPNLVYFSGIFSSTAVILGVGLVLASRHSIGFWALLGFAAAAVLPASEVAIQIINYLVSQFVPPRFIPRMSFEKGIPDEFRTLVAVPTMLLTPESIRSEIEKLEMRYLANPEPNLFFALLTDFADAPYETMPEDRGLYEIAFRGIGGLNKRYGSGRFVYFHRTREWCETQKRWIGWERKRGKLDDLNRFLNGEMRNDRDDFLRIGDSEILRGVRFVITLDADTKLPHKAAIRLVEAMAHPLNRPDISADGRLVSSGYGVIQPRVAATLPSVDASFFSSLYGNARGTDPYAHAISDLYQDLFGDGIFIGKAIYDVRAFHKVLSGRFPEQTLLSHDLIEGNYLRVGFDSTVLLFEQFPSNYQAFSNRQHRWIRGDWQIANWMMPRVPEGSTGKVRNPLSLINRWKILDNMRRSLVPPACMAVLLGSWLIMSNSAFWNIYIAFAIFIPAITPIPARVREGVKGNFFVWRNETTELLRALATTALLPYQAWVSIDAVARACFRRVITRRNLLEWESAQVVHWRSLNDRSELSFRVITICAGTALLIGLLAYRGFSVWPAAAPYLGLWLLSPLISRWIDKPRRAKKKRELAEAERLFVRRIARETWRYFDDLVGPEGHWLPPDNSQESLRVEVAYRTSPTNIGLWLLSAVAAHDLGFITLDHLVNRLSASFESICRLEKSQGHLLNWYDIKTLQPLSPRYISTVDSGNLLASLWTLDQGLSELRSCPVIRREDLAGLSDAVAVLEEICNKEESLSPNAKSLISELAKAGREDSGGLDSFWNYIRRIRSTCDRLSTGLLPEIESLRRNINAAQEIGYWVHKIADTAEACESAMRRYYGWLPMLLEAPAGVRQSPEFSGLMQQLLNQPPFSLSQLAADYPNPLPAIMEKLQRLGGESVEWINGIHKEISFARTCALETDHRIQTILDQSRQMQDEMRLNSLYDADRKIFAIGKDVDEASQSTSYYDLLASEARLTSLIAIARGEVDSEHWQALGRPFGLFGGHRLLYSWSGSMFEYLMPLIFTRSFDSSLLHHACSEAVSIQIIYGRQRRVPWGISESAFSELDSNQIYQYRAFGVPALGLKRDLADDLVVAPYATALALMVDPHEAIKNMKRLIQAGSYGSKGFFEAIDYSRESREGKCGVIVYAYMAHHQGMSLLSMDNVLRDNIMQKRFHTDLRVRAVEPLLYEGIPPSKDISYLNPPEERLPSRLIATPVVSIPKRYYSEKTPSPRIQLFSNGSYSCMVTNSGGGYSRWRDYDITRWRADPTRDHWGSYCYIRDLDTGEFWSTTYHPTDKSDTGYSVTYHSARVTFKRMHKGIQTVMEVAVSPEDDVEVRRIDFSNRSLRTRRIELTTYAELALASHAADRAHPAFSKLFIQTEVCSDKGALLAHRRAGAENESTIWAGQLIASDVNAKTEFETSRARFLGRGNGLEFPMAITGRLSNSSGSVTDPIFSLRRELVLAPGEKAQMTVVTLAAESRDRAMQLIDRYRDLAAADRVFELAWAHTHLSFRFIRIQKEDAQRFQELAGYMLYPNGWFRAGAERLRRNALGQSRLWAFSISGDLPICAVVISDALDIGTVREALQAHTFWHEHGLISDLVIINNQSGGYDQPLQQQLTKLIQVHSVHTGVNRPGGVFLRSAEMLSGEDITLILSAAQVVLYASRGSLARQLGNLPENYVYPPLIERSIAPSDYPVRSMPLPELDFYNGIGGFAEDGCEYVIRLNGTDRTPAPWINVLANPGFGALVDEAGKGVAWHRNSQMNRLTPWLNDPVATGSSENIYLRDEESGKFWTATEAPPGEAGSREIHHGQGYTRFKQYCHGIGQDLLVFVPVDEKGGEPVRIQRLQLSNQTKRKRRLTVTSYSDWVLGNDREQTQLHVVTSWDTVINALLARNAYNSEFSNFIAFAAATPAAASYSADRTGFLGRNGSLKHPAALERRSLSGRTGTGLDPCAALQIRVELDPGQNTEIAFLLGQAETVQDVRSIVEKYSSFKSIEEAFRETQGWWNEMLGTVHVSTPEKSADLLINRWLLYETLSCRIWARTALYQSGGAYGFRDQLQDVMALVYGRPGLARQHILTSAARQFLEGDVQHWWHPQSGAGVRTHCSDDLLWLPFVTTHYVETTGDREILDVRIPFLEGQSLKENEPEAYSVPSISMTDGTLFEHCRRAIERGYRTGIHGLPLIGSCDWNDGFNRVGTGGRGESVWLAWFLMDVLKGFLRISVARNENDLVTQYENRIRQLQSAIDRSAWDGEWYQRAYFDDGTPLGSRRNSECRIDSLAQSWGAIAGDPSQEHVRQALQAVDRHLVRESDKLILLFAPPFQDFEPNPGYIKSYPPGVRENGGQYTHAALWVALAFLRQGDGRRAVDLLRMLNPVELTQTYEDAVRYQCEPYAPAADVYSLEGQVGRGGWTWYTGSNAWMYRIWIEEVLGFKLRGETLSISPTIPADWPGFSLSYRYRNSLYSVTVVNPDHVGHGVAWIEHNGERLSGDGILLQDDGREHRIQIQMGREQVDTYILIGQAGG